MPCMQCHNQTPSLLYSHHEVGHICIIGATLHVSSLPPVSAALGALAKSNKVVLCFYLTLWLLCNVMSCLLTAWNNKRQNKMLVPDWAQCGYSFARPTACILWYLWLEWWMHVCQSKLKQLCLYIFFSWQAYGI